MSGVAGNNAWWMFQVQTAKGTPATVALPINTTAGKKVGAFKVPFSGGNIEPNRVFGKLAETDSSRDVGVSFPKVGGLTGTAEAYVRADSIGALMYYVCGESTEAGTEKKWTHTAKPATTIPYVTFWRAIHPGGGTPELFEQFEDCFLSSLQIKTTAGEPLTAAATVQGIKTTRLTADPSTAASIPLDKEYVYNFNDAIVKVNTVESSLISSFDMTINNAVTALQTDSFSPLDVVAGLRTIDLTFDIVFESITQYNEFNYGASGGTAESNKLFTSELEFEFKQKPTGHEEETLKFKFPKVAYETYPITPNTSGAPIVVAVKGVAQRNTPIFESVITNEVALYK